MIVLSRLLLSSLLLPKEKASMVHLHGACRTCLLKHRFRYPYLFSVFFPFLPVFLLVMPFRTLLMCFKLICPRLLLLRYRVFLSLVGRKRLCNVHRKANCGDQHLFLHLSLVIRFLPSYFSVFHLPLPPVANH